MKTIEVNSSTGKTKTQNSRTRLQQYIMLLAILFITVASILIFKKFYTPKNVFDEMYQIERKTIKKQKKIGFANMDSITSSARDNVNYPGNMISENYKDSVLENDESISFLFLFDSHELHITYSRELEKDIFLIIRYQYKDKKNQLKQFITIHDEHLPETFTVEEKEQINNYLKTYKITKEELKNTAHNVLYKRVLPDWFEAYDSKFSVDNLGNVTIEKDDFLE